MMPAQTVRHRLGYSSTANLTYHLLQPLMHARLGELVWIFTVFCASWLVLTFGLLMIFRASMCRARLRLHHAARCVVYSFDAVAWCSLLFATALAVNAMPNMAGLAAKPIAWFILLSLPFVWLAMSYRLAVAYELYLRFDRPRWTILSVQLIVALIVPLALLVLPAIV